MRGKFSTVTILAGAMLLALQIGSANAKSDKEKCTSTTFDVTKTNVDENTCTSEVGGSGPNNATATASEESRASSDAEDGADATADAIKGGFAVANVVSGEGTAIALAGGGSEVDIADGGKATSKAVGMGSSAQSQIEGTGGVSNALAEGSGFADATIETGGGGSAISIAKQAGTSFAFVDESDSGTAKAISTDHAFAKAGITGNCSVTAIASGRFHDDQSSAVGDCVNEGSVVTVEATGGSIAQGSDTKPPICEPQKGFKATVRSPAGNCGQ